MNIPTYNDICQTHTLLSRYLRRMPLTHSPQLSALGGANVWLKSECFAEIVSL